MTQASDIAGVVANTGQNFAQASDIAGVVADTGQ